MEAHQHRTTLRLLIGFAALLLCLLVALIMSNNSSSDLRNVLIASVLLGTLTMLHAQGWRQVPYITVLAIDALAAWTLPTDQQYIVAVVPAIIAFVLTDTRWLIGSAVGVYGVVLLRSGFAGPYSDSGAIGGYCLIIGVLCIARQNFDATSASLAAMKKLEQLRLATYHFAGRISDELTCALGYLDLFAMTTPIMRDEGDLHQAHQELEQATRLVRQFNETTLQEEVLPNIILAEPESDHTFRITGR